MDDVKTPVHGEECKCTYCDDKNQKLFKEVPELGDGLGNVTPEVYNFAEQSKEEVKELLDKSEGKPKTLAQEYAKAMKEFPDPRDGDACLTFQDELSDIGVPNLKYVKDTADYNKCLVSEDIGHVWRKLSGVKPNERPQDETFREFTDKIILKAQKEFDQLQVDWSEDCYDQCLTVNGARTRIRKDLLNEAYEALKLVTDEYDAAQIVCDIVTKKLKMLF